jgi:hypothetical protein
MAIYHLSVKAISRSAGRSATAAAAYRAGCQITDARTGEVHDFTRKKGVESADIVLPDGAPEWASDRAKLWNAAELTEKRKDACVAREYEVALPAELSHAERRRLALDFAREMANAEGCAVDVAMHAPGRDGDNRNFHAHIMRTTRKVGADGLTEKLDTEKAGRSRRNDLDAVRQRWAELVNERLAENALTQRIDHRSLKDQGIDRTSTSHLGPAVTEMKRKKKQSEVLARIEAEVMIEKVRKNSISADEFLIQKTQRQIEAAQAELDDVLKKMREEKPLVDIVISRPMPQQELNVSTSSAQPKPNTAPLYKPDIVISQSAETPEQYVARKSEQTNRRFTIAQLGKLIIGTLEKVKCLADQIYGVVDVGLGDRTLVRHDFSHTDVGKKLKGYQRPFGFESDLDRGPKGKGHGVSRGS